MFANTLLTLFFVVFISAKPERKLFFTHALVYFNNQREKNDQTNKAQGRNWFWSSLLIKFLLILAPAVVIDDLERELLDKRGGKARGELGERKLICPWAVGQNTVPALFSVSALSLRNDDTLLQAHINL